ncbi:hypothetical protein CRG98_018202 [Punica granatum]|uniref:Uncharacterized protein n=1 Tax=Punica granatum TaxID=22663 RepID=A0A2I0JYG5_PUNGR|nr:hypothetical protein CRG98_018202 [Punica granatum]
MLPSLDARGKESGKWPWESRDSDRWLQVRDPRVGSRGSPGKNGSARAPGTARCKIGLVGLLRDGSKRSWVVPSVPSPKQARNSGRKFGKNTRNSVRKKTVKQ